MASENFKRKLVAIISADVQGYSRLMGQDDDTTVRTLKVYREVMFNLVNDYDGRVVDSPGDNILAEFASVVDAVKCAVDIQNELKSRNAALPEHRKMKFRIGINLGDIIEDEGRIYGDGVNIAARLEGLSNGGGICISRSAFEQVKSKLSLGYEDLGEHTVKNIIEPVRVYRVLMDPNADGQVISDERSGLKSSRRAKVIGVVLFFGIAALASYHFYFRSAPLSKKPASEAKTSISLNEKPSIAVLPFINLSGNPEQAYFSDGITNDIITDLSKFQELWVIASNTVFTYKDKPVKIKDIHRDLGVRYVLEGSVQKVGGKVRINVQLIDAAADHHIWAERYDKDFKDLFKLQNELVQSIVTKLAIQIDETERKRIMKKKTGDLQAYDYLLRGWEYIYQNTREGNKQARRMFQQAIDIDSSYSSAYAALSWSHLFDFLYGWTVFPEKSLERAQDLAKKALSLDETSALAHSALGTVYLRRKQYELAIGELQQAIKLNPNDTQSQSQLGSVMLYSGRKDAAIYWLESALRLNPHISFGDLMVLGQAYYLSGRYEDAITILNTGLAENPNYVGYYIMLAAAYARAGRIEAAKRPAREVLRLDPFFEVGSYGTVFRNPEDRSGIIDGLRKAGLK
jgi:adenylate cyclase